MSAQRRFALHPRRNRERRLDGEDQDFAVTGPAGVRHGPDQPCKPLHLVGWCRHQDHLVRQEVVHRSRIVWARFRAASPEPSTAEDGHAGKRRFLPQRIDQFDELREESARRPLVMGIVLHTHILGQPHRLRQFRRVIEHILKYRDQIWLTRTDDICKFIESLPAGVVPGR